MKKYRVFRVFIRLIWTAFAICVSFLAAIGGIFAGAYFYSWLFSESFPQSNPCFLFFSIPFMLSGGMGMFLLNCILAKKAMIPII